MVRKRNRPFSFRDLDPMDWKAARHYDWVEPKYDGHFARIEIDDKQARVYSSTDRLVETVTLHKRYKRTILWAEHLRGTAWACAPSRRDRYEHFAVFAASVINGKTQAFPHAALTRESIERLLSRNSHALFDRMFLVDRWPASKVRGVWTRLVGREGYEGLVLGGPQGLARMKARASYDYVCMGFDESDSAKYAGCGVRSVLGGLYVNGKLKQVSRVGGLTDGQRMDFYLEPHRYVGRVFEAQGKCLYPSGKLRHPDFLRWRDDKDPITCVPPSV